MQNPTQNTLNLHPVALILHSSTEPPPPLSSVGYSRIREDYAPFAPPAYLQTADKDMEGVEVGGGRRSIEVRYSSIPDQVTIPLLDIGRPQPAPAPPQPAPVLPPPIVMHPCGCCHAETMSPCALVFSLMVLVTVLALIVVCNLL